MNKKNYKKNIYIDYDIKNSEEYIGNSFPPLIYKALLNSPNYNVFHHLDKNLPKLDCAIIINGGSHWKYKDINLKNFHYKQIIIWLYPKIYKLIFFLGRIFGLYKLKFYQRHMFNNKSYEKHFDNLIKQNPGIKIIHRLDGIYQNICKVYGYDISIKYINDKSDITIHQSNYSKISWNEGENTIFGKTQKLNSSKEIIIPNWVDTNIFNPNGEKINLRGEWKILNVSASGNPRKGLSQILEIAECLKDNPNIIFYLIGKQILDPISGSDLKHFKNVIYLGEIKNRNLLAKYYRSSDIFIFPSINDCSPNVILEAMASGLPVLTCDSGGNSELIDNKEIKGGLFINKQNPVLSLNTTIENYDSLKKNALRIIEKNYNFDNTIKKYFDIIDKLTIS